MSFVKKSSLTVIAILAVVFSFSTISFAKTKEGSFSNIKIDNFGQMDERFYRGGRPKAQDYPALAALGIKTIIDLTDNSKEYEQPAVEAAGLRYINIPMVDKSYPGMDQVSAFLKVVDDPATGKFYVHCAGGRHRTGVMGAVYRFNYDHWNLAQAFAEMNQYEFGSGMGHGKQKSFVEDYWNQFQAKHATATVAATAGR
jgi:protein tyrosine/serine phosphatase